MASGTETHKLEGHSGSVRSVAISPDSKTIQTLPKNLANGGRQAKLTAISVKIFFFSMFHNNNCVII